MAETDITTVAMLESECAALRSENARLRRVAETSRPFDHDITKVKAIDCVNLRAALRDFDDAEAGSIESQRVRYNVCVRFEPTQEDIAEACKRAIEIVTRERDETRKREAIAQQEPRERAEVEHLRRVAKEARTADFGGHDHYGPVDCEPCAALRELRVLLDEAETPR